MDLECGPERRFESKKSKDPCLRSMGARAESASCDSAMHASARQASRPLAKRIRKNLTAWGARAVQDPGHAHASAVGVEATQATTKICVRKEESD